MDLGRIANTINNIINLSAGVFPRSLVLLFWANLYILVINTYRNKPLVLRVIPFIIIGTTIALIYLLPARLEARTLSRLVLIIILELSLLRRLELL